MTRFWRICSAYFRKTEMILPCGNGVLLALGAGENTLDHNDISGNQGNGVLMDGDPTSLNTLTGNNIGTDGAGSFAIFNGLDGVRLANGASWNTIGGTQSGQGNLISGNKGAGVRIDSGTGTTFDNVVAGNYIGTDHSGTVAIPNSTGVIISGSDTNAGNTIGGTVAAAGNVISGNTNAGVEITGSGSKQNQVAANYIGTDVNGTSPIPNVNGVYVSGDHNTIGGTVAGARNLISGNSRAGVDLSGSGATNNLVAGNNIGVGAQGNETTVGNGVWGIIFEGRASNNKIGGEQDDSTRNVISNNGSQGSTTDPAQGHGIYLARGSTGNVIEGNYIGVDRANGSTPLGNAADGIYVEATANSNTIGGTVAAARNVISDNGGGGFLGESGVEVFGALNVVAANYIGVAADGRTALGNERDGVLVNGANNTIGGTAAAAGNVISANGTPGTVGYGLDILAGATGTVYDYDFIGFDSTGAVLVPNEDGGVNNLGTGTVPGTHNKIQPQ
jgi:titin